MKNKKDISDLIRQNQHLLDERPSPRAWRKLESKLDGRRVKHQSFLYRQLAMAAAVVALVAVISLITVLTNQQKENYAALEKAPIAWEVQDLETVYTDANTEYRQVIEFQKQLKYRSSNPIQEGTAAKKLLASHVTYKTSSNQQQLAINQKPSLKQQSTHRNSTASTATKPENIMGDIETEISTDSNQAKDIEYVEFKETTKEEGKFPDAQVGIEKSKMSTSSVNKNSKKKKMSRSAFMDTVTSSFFGKIYLEKNENQLFKFISKNQLLWVNHEEGKNLEEHTYYYQINNGQLIINSSIDSNKEVFQKLNFEANKNIFRHKNLIFEAIEKVKLGEKTFE